MANGIIKNGKRVVKSTFITLLLIGVVFTGTGCAFGNSNNKGDAGLGGGNIDTPSHTPSTDVEVMPFLTSEECLKSIDEFVGKHFNFEKCEVQSIATQKEDTGALSVTTHKNYRGLKDFEAVDFVIQAKINGEDKAYAFIIPVPFDIYMNHEILVDSTSNLSVKRTDIEKMHLSHLESINDLFDKMSNYYNTKGQSMVGSSIADDFVK